jgi:hypothetical protein
MTPLLKIVGRNPSGRFRMTAPRRTLARLVLTPLALCAAILSLAACGRGGISGTYGTAEKNNIVFKFSGDQVTVTKEGESVTGKFKADAKTLTVFNPQGESLSFKIDDNGCLYDGGILISFKACKQ